MAVVIINLGALIPAAQREPFQFMTSHLTFIICTFIATDVLFGRHNLRSQIDLLLATGQRRQFNSLINIADVLIDVQNLPQTCFTAKNVSKRSMYAKGRIFTDSRSFNKF